MVPNGATALSDGPLLRPHRLSSLTSLACPLSRDSPAARRWRPRDDARYVSPRSSLVIGFLASPGAWLALSFKRSLGVDDALDCFAVHGSQWPSKMQVK